MAKKSIKESVGMADEPKITEIEKELDESAADSLKPNSHSVDSPKSKPEAMAAVIGMLGKMPEAWALDHYKEIYAQYEKWKTNAAKGSADSNKSSINMKGSDAEGSGGPVAGMPMVKQAEVQKWVAGEEAAAIFAGEKLTEEAQEKIGALFEAAVSMRVSLVEAELEKKYEEELTEALATYIEETKQGLDNYIDYAVEQWMSENEVAVVDTLRLENAEAFMKGMQNLFAESYWDIPEDRLDIVKEMSEKVIDLESKLDEAVKVIADLSDTLEEKTQADIFAEATEGLTLSDSEKMKTLTEAVTFEGDPEVYKRKLTVIREQYFKKAPPASSGSVDQLNEEGTTFDQKRGPAVTDPFVASALRGLERAGR